MFLEYSFHLPFPRALKVHFHLDSLLQEAWSTLLQQTNLVCLEAPPCAFVEKHLQPLWVTCEDPRGIALSAAWCAA